MSNVNQNKRLPTARSTKVEAGALLTQTPEIYISKYKGRKMATSRCHCVFEPFWECQRDNLPQEQWKFSFNSAKAAVNRALAEHRAAGALAIALASSDELSYDEAQRSLILQ